jgi:hypothetical protein
MRFFIIMASIICFAGFAQADIRDARFIVDGDEGRIWLAFDTQPVGVVLTPTPTGVVLEIQGVAAEPHFISPPDRQLITALRLAPSQTGGRAELTASQAWSGASAEIRRGGVLVTVHLSVHLSVPDPVEGRPEHDASPAALPLSAAPPDAQVETSRQPPPTSGPDPAAEIADTGPVLDPCEQAAAAVELNPWDDRVLMDHAGCLASAGEVVAAAGIYEQMLAFEPENFDAAMALAMIRVHQGDSSAAQALFAQAASHAASDAEAARARTLAHELQGE